MKSGIYVIDLGEDLLKIGRSSNIQKRLLQYKGYRGSVPRQFMLIYTKHHKYMEQQLHNFADLRLSRIDRLEIFKCHNKQTFVTELNIYLMNNFKASYLYVDYCGNDYAEIVENDQGNIIKKKEDNMSEYFEQYKYVKKR